MEPDIPCQPNPKCKYYYEGCFEDTHHIYKKADADTKIEKAFCLLVENTVEICRERHEEWESQIGWAEYPSLEVMKAAIERHKNGSTKNNSG